MCSRYITPIPDAPKPANRKVSDSTASTATRTRKKVTAASTITQVTTENATVFSAFPAAAYSSAPNRYFT